jgi:O-antigen ligase
MIATSPSSRSPSPILLVKSLASPAGALAAYIWAGIFKAMLPGSMARIDLTALLGVVVILCIGFEILTSKRRLRLSIIFVMAFGAYVMSLIFSLTYTIASIDVVMLQLFRLVVVDGVAVVGALSLINTPQRLQSFILAHVILGLGISLSAIVAAVPGQVILRGVGGSSYIADARLVAIALGSCISLFGFQGITEQAMVIILGAGVLILSARGPFIVLALCLPGLVMHRMRSIKRLHILTIAGILFVVCVFMLLNSHGYFVTIKQRLARVIPGAVGLEDTSVINRIYFGQSAIKMFLERPILGWGLSSYPSYIGGVGNETPHNLFLELLCELGIMGFLAFVIMLAMSAHRLRSIQHAMTDGVSQALWFSFAFWILTIPGLGLGSVRPFLCLLAVINACFANRASSFKCQLKGAI